MRGAKEQQVLCVAFLAGVLVGMFLFLLTVSTQTSRYFGKNERAGHTDRKTLRVEEKGGIPHIIHQTWKDRFVPGELTSSILSWRKNHPTWQYWFWTENGFMTLLESKYKKFSPIYHSLLYQRNKEELQRYIIMHEYGGFYVHLDMESLRPLDPLLEKHKCIITKGPEEHNLVHQCDKSQPLMSNALFGCVPKHPFFRLLLELLPEYVSMAKNQALTGSEKDPTGHCMISDVLSLYLQHFNKSQVEYVQLLESELFLPTFNEGYRQQIETTCTDASGLTESQKVICTLIQERDHKNAPSPISYTVSHWHDLYGSSSTSPRAVETVLSAGSKKGKNRVT